MRTLVTLREGATALTVQPDGFLHLDCAADGIDAIKPVRSDDGYALALPKPGGVILLTDKQMERLAWAIRDMMLRSRR